MQKIRFILTMNTTLQPGRNLQKSAVHILWSSMARKALDFFMLSAVHKAPTGAGLGSAELHYKEIL